MTNSSDKKRIRNHKVKSWNAAAKEEYVEQTKKMGKYMPSSSSLPPTHLFLGVVLSIVAAALASWYQQQQSFLLNDRDFYNATKPTLSQLFRIACQSNNNLVHCNDYLLDIHDGNRSISAKHQHKSGTGLQKGWKLLTIQRNVQIWSEFTLKRSSFGVVLLWMIPHKIVSSQFLSYPVKFYSSDKLR
jgi:hypothetical protein